MSKTYDLNRCSRLIPAVGIVLAICLTAGILCGAGRPERPGGVKTGVIVIDPGHGGVDGGTGDRAKGDAVDRARGDGLLEKDINLKLSLMLRTQLEQMGYAVVMTRDSDVSLEGPGKGGSRHARDLSARVSRINSGDTLLFLSIHVNSIAGNPRESGSLVFYGRRFVQSRILAHCIQGRLNEVTADGKPRTQHAPLPGRYYILGRTRAPGVLVETAFISNPGERALLATDEFLERLASAIAGGTDAFLKSEKAPVSPW